MWDFLMRLLELKEPDDLWGPVTSRLGPLLPEPFRSLEEWSRFTQQDLEFLPVAALRREARRLQLALLDYADESEAPPWAAARISQIGAEIKRRGAAWRRR